jgi:hypothetical protein
MQIADRGSLAEVGVGAECGTFQSQAPDKDSDAITALKNCIYFAVKTKNRVPDLIAINAASSIR